MHHNFNKIKIFIISYNRLTYLKKLINWLENYDFKNIEIIDNNSSYLPLIDFLKKTKYTVHFMEENWGPLVLWKNKLFKEIVDNQFYIVSDCDILPIDECPKDFLKYFYNILISYVNIGKVGFSLKIDDIPERYQLKSYVLYWEKRFWKYKVPGHKNLFDAPIDTTFALYKPNIYPNDKKWLNAIRVGYPYTARHLPWYEVLSDSEQEEIIYYKNTSNKKFTWWTDMNNNYIYRKIYNIENTKNNKKILSLLKTFLVKKENIKIIYLTRYLLKYLYNFIKFKKSKHSCF